MSLSFCGARRFVGDARGSSAVEMAIVAPLLAFALLGLADVGQVIYQRTDMHGALRSGGQYVLNGGRDLQVAREIVVRSWTSMPDDAVVEATRACLCAETEHACSAPCADGSVPEAYIGLRAQATLNGILVDIGDAADDSIRIR